MTPSIDRILRADERVDILVVDDNSPDGTGDIAARVARDDARVAVLRRPAKAGLGSAYRAGFRHGLDAGYDAVVEMDADLSHPADRLPVLLDALQNADLAIGSRYVPGGQVAGWPLRRRLLSEAANRYVQLRTGLPVRDATSGYRAYRRAAVEQFALSSSCSGYAFQLELTLDCWQAGLRIVEVPITFVERAAGASKMSRKIMAEAARFVWTWPARSAAAAPTTPLPSSRSFLLPRRALATGVGARRP